MMNGPALALGHAVMRATAAATALSLLAGCSFIAARGPESDRRRGHAPSCNSTNGAVAVDGLISVGGLVTGLSGNDGADVVGGLIGAIYLGSAIYGYSASKRCDQARADYELELVDIEHEQERARKREREALAKASPPPPPVLSPPAVVRPAPPPVAPPVVRPTIPPTPSAAPTGVIDPFANPAPPSGAIVESDTDADGDDAAHDTPADADVSAEELELRWREFWRRLP